MNELQAFQVLVARPGGAGELLCERIRALGGKAYHFPTIAFAEPIDKAALVREVAVIGDLDWLIFISPQAVVASVPLIRATWPEFPPQLKLAAIGEATAAALKQAGYLVAAVPKQWSTEGLMALPAFLAIRGQKVGIVRGEGGRELLEKILLERGATVSHIIAYRRVLPDVDATEPLRLLQEGKINAIICGSYEAVKNLKTLLGEKSWPRLREQPLLVMSERIKSLAENLGFQTIWVTQEPISELVRRK